MRYVLIFVLIGIGFTSSAFAQYLGDLGYPVNIPNECIGGPGEDCPLEIIDKAKWKAGTIKWDKTLYQENPFSKINTKVIVSDFDMNTHPTIKDWIAIQLWSKSSPDKITISQLFESSENSGIFEGQIILLNETSNSFQNKLKVNQTDTIFASYYDWTLPENQNSTKIEIIADSKVNHVSKIFYDSPLKQFKSGILPKDVVCKEGLKLFLKNWIDQPVCLKDSSVKTLTLCNYIYNGFGLSEEEIPSENLTNKNQTTAHSRPLTLFPVNPQTVKIPNTAKKLQDTTKIILINKTNQIKITDIDSDQETHLAQIYIDKAILYTKNIENLPARSGFNTLVFDYSIQSKDKNAFYATVDFEIQFGPIKYPTSLKGDEFLDILFPNEKRDSTFAVQIGKGVNQIILNIRDSNTQKILWIIPIDLTPHTTKCNGCHGNLIMD